MTTYTLASTASTQATIRARILAALDAAGAPTQGWSARAPQRVLVDDVADWLATESGVRAALALSIDLSDPDASDEDWIDLFATFFDETRTSAIATVWDVPMTASSLPLTVQPSTKITIQSTNGVYFDLAQTANAALPATLRFTARVAGLTGNVTPTQLQSGRIITGPAGLTFNGVPTLYTSGAAKESNAALVTRCLGKWARLGAGWTDEAFDYLIPTAAPTVTKWSVDSSNPIGPGSVVAYLASAAGPATVQEVADVQAALTARDVKPLGSGAFLAQACGVYTLSFTVRIYTDESNPTLNADLAAAVATLEAALPIGPGLDRALLEAVLRGEPVGEVDMVVYSTLSTRRVQIGTPGFRGVFGVLALTSNVGMWPAGANEVMDLDLTLEVVTW